MKQIIFERWTVFVRKPLKNNLGKIIFQDLAGATISNYSKVLVLFTTSFLLFDCGPKLSIEELKEKHYFLAIHHSRKGEIFIAKKPQKLSEDNRGIIYIDDTISINAKVTAVLKKESKLYYRVDCSESIKKDCDKGGFAYFDTSLPGYVLVPESEKKAFIEMREWVTKDNNKLPTTLSEFYIKSHVEAVSGSASLEIARGYFMFFEMLKNRSIKDARLKKTFFQATVAKVESILADGTESSWTESPYSKLKVSDSISKYLAEKIKTLDKETIEAFPMSDITWLGLAKYFNNLNKIPYIQEKILATALKDSVWVVYGTDKYKYIGFDKKNKELKEELTKLAANPDSAQLGLYSNWTIVFKEGEGVFVKEEIYNSSHKLLETVENTTIDSVSASDADGLKFLIQTANGLYTLEPLIQGKYLAESGPGSFIKKIPSDHKELFANGENYSLQLMKFAMKNGKGGFDPATGKMIYEVETIGKMFWKVFDAFRASPSVKKETDFKGTIDLLYTGEFESAEMTWYKPKELEVRVIFSYKYGYGSGDNKMQREEATCMYEGNRLIVEFLPSEVNSNSPQISVTWSPREGNNNVCNNFDRSTIK
ncbi:MAG: hypothetical protein KBA66_19355 [Leptospiraceae bacterium]|nr:hypothetical protein [Leptospiraceae bacterium]